MPELNVTTPTGKTPPVVQSKSIEAFKDECAEKYGCEYNKRTDGIKHRCGRCQSCSQQRCSCGGEPAPHVRVFIHVDDELCRKYFPGISVNGVWYNNSCIVPQEVAVWIEAAAKRWERDEIDTRQGKTRRFGLGNLQGSGV